MSNTPFLPDANRSLSLELSALENLGKSFRNVFVLLTITFAIIIFFNVANYICSYFTQKALAEISTVFFLICWFGGMIFYLSVVVVLILFLINIWNTPASIVRGGGIGKVFVGLIIACIGLFFCIDAVPIEYIAIPDFIGIVLVIAEIIVYWVYIKRLAGAIGSTQVKNCMNCFLYGAFLGFAMSLESSVIENQTIRTIVLVVGIIFGLVSFFSFLLSLYFMSTDISAFIEKRKQQSEDCQPENQQ